MSGNLARCRYCCPVTCRWMAWQTVGRISTMRWNRRVHWGTKHSARPIGICWMGSFIGRSKSFIAD